jgi:hypothetical protein
LGEFWRTRQKFRNEFKDRGFDRCFDHGLTNVSGFDPVNSVISINDVN